MAPTFSPLFVAALAFLLHQTLAWASAPWPLGTLQSGKDTVVQYVSSKGWESRDVFRQFSKYCYFNKCQHVVVRGDCGYGPKMCKRMVHAAIANVTRARTVFADNDVLPKDPQLNAFGDLCGNHAFSVGCRFTNLKLHERQRTNSGVMCINHNAVDFSQKMLSLIDPLAKCSFSAYSDQHAFFSLYRWFYGIGMLHCIDESRFSQPWSKDWPHFWGDLKRNVSHVAANTDGQHGTIRHPSIVVELNTDTMDVSKVVLTDWQGETIEQEGRFSLGDSSEPSSEQAFSVAPFIMEDAISVHLCDV